MFDFKTTEQERDHWKEKYDEVRDLFEDAKMEVGESLSLSSLYCSSALVRVVLALRLRCVVLRLPRDANVMVTTPGRGAGG
jgi:hypothetical protein